MNDTTTVEDRMTFAQEWVMSGMVPDRPVFLNGRTVHDLRAHLCTILGKEVLELSDVEDIDRVYGCFGWMLERSAVPV